MCKVSPPLAFLNSNGERLYNLAVGYDCMPALFETFPSHPGTRTSVPFLACGLFWGYQGKKLKLRTLQGYLRILIKTKHITEMILGSHRSQV